MSARSTDVMPQHFTYTGKTATRTYKIFLFAHNIPDAESIFHAMLKKMFIHSLEKAHQLSKKERLFYVPHVTEFFEKLDREISLFAETPPYIFDAEVIYGYPYSNLNEVLFSILDESGKEIYSFNFLKEELNISQVIATETTQNGEQALHGGIKTAQGISRDADLTVQNSRPPLVPQPAPLRDMELSDKFRQFLSLEKRSEIMTKNLPINSFWLNIDEGQRQALWTKFNEAQTQQVSFEDFLAKQALESGFDVASFLMMISPPEMAEMKKEYQANQSSLAVSITQLPSQGLFAPEVAGPSAPARSYQYSDLSEAEKIYVSDLAARAEDFGIEITAFEFWEQQSRGKKEDILKRFDQLVQAVLSSAPKPSF